MMSYKQWQLLKESLHPLGLSQAQNISPIVGKFQYLDEKKKHMDAEEEIVDDDDVADDDDGDEEEEGGKPMKKDKCGDEDSSMFCKKMMKKKMKSECGCEDKGKKPVEAGDDDDGEEDYNNDDDEGGDEGEDEEMGGDDEGGMKRPLGFMKKKGMKKNMKKKMSKKMKKESAAPNEFLQSFNSYVAPENQMTSEDAWWSSVQSHFSNPNQKFNDGFSEYMEDYLIDPTAAEHFRSNNASQVDSQTTPRPGDVGYAPQGRVGGSFFG